MTAARSSRARDAALTKGIAAIVCLTFVALVGLRIRKYTNATAPHQSMPTDISNEAERSVFLNPQGLYTLSDIVANGDQLPSEKFRSFIPAHDLQPSPGERICPITRTKGNPACTWVIGGSRYEFCCPPCIAEFVQIAKQNPDDVLPREAYVKSGP